MQGVAESTSEKILLLVDELISEGHSPAHFARQLVRFLRNVTVAKIAGKDSALLQISDDERARAARIAESAKKTWRHLQIMLAPAATRLIGRTGASTKNLVAEDVARHSDCCHWSNC